MRFHPSQFVPQTRLGIPAPKKLLKSLKIFRAGAKLQQLRANPPRSPRLGLKLLTRTPPAREEDGRCSWAANKRTARLPIWPTGNELRKLP